MEQLLSSSTSPIMQIDNPTFSRQQAKQHTDLSTSASNIPTSYEINPAQQQQPPQQFFSQILTQAPLQSIMSLNSLHTLPSQQGIQTKQYSQHQLPAQQMQQQQLFNSQQVLGNPLINHFNNQSNLSNHLISYPNTAGVATAAASQTPNQPGLSLQQPIALQFNPNTFQLMNQHQILQMQQQLTPLSTQNVFNIAIPFYTTQQQFTDSNQVQLQQQQQQQQQQQVQFMRHSSETDGRQLEGTMYSQQQSQIGSQLFDAGVNINNNNTYNVSGQKGMIAQRVDLSQNQMRSQYAICSKHQYKQDSALSYLCTTSKCNEQFHLMCSNCVRDHQATTSSHEIVELSKFLSQTRPKVLEMVQTAALQKTQIEALFIQNIQGLESMQTYISNLLESVQSLQRAYTHVKQNISEDSAAMCSTIKELENGHTHLDEDLFKEKVQFLYRVSQDMQFMKFDGLKHLVSTNENIGGFISSTKEDVDKIQQFMADLQSNFSRQMIGSEMKEQEKKHQEDKTLDHFSKLFHLIKGHAKKRDVINFLTWEPFTKELKYSKDIKDKHGEHFYVSFSLRLKNIENMETKEIDESFISKVVSVVEDKAPEIQNKKNVERKKIDPNGKKRKYCRFNPRIEIDVTLDASAYKNIKIE